MFCKRSFVTALALGMLLAGCSDPKAVVVHGDLPTFVHEKPAAIAALKADDLALFHRFMAEYEATASAPQGTKVAVEMPRRFDGRTLGQVLEAAKAYFAARDKAVVARQREIDDRYTTQHERGEYSTPVDASLSGPDGSGGADRAVELEVLRGGPHGEPRLFETPAERAGLVNGQTPRFLNAQFRYYLADVALVQPKESGCPHPVLALKLAVENLSGMPTASIYGKFTFAQADEGDASFGSVVGVPYHADIIGPFPERQGGITYVTAYVERTTEIADGMNWGKALAIAPARRKVWFSPEAFYYPGGDQYVAGAGRAPATRQALTCGG